MTERTLTDYFNSYFMMDQDSDPVCREEPQYVLFLYKRLLDMSGHEVSSSGLSEEGFERGVTDADILAACGVISPDREAPEKKVTVTRVIYEVNFLRHVFSAERDVAEVKLGLTEKQIKALTLDDSRVGDCMNRRLYEYVSNALDPEGSGKFSGLEAKVYAYRNLYGGCDKLKDYPRLNSALQRMMNVTPDLALIYEVEGEACKHLKFVECKYMSDEDVYSKKEEKPRITQRYVQNMIGKFLCEKLLEEGKLCFDRTQLLHFKTRLQIAAAEAAKAALTPKAKKRKPKDPGPDGFDARPFEESILELESIVPEKWREEGLL